MVTDRIVLRPYQQEMAEKIIEATYKKSRALLSVPPGCGRTITIAWAFNELFKRGKLKRALIIASSKALHEQLYSFFNEKLILPVIKLDNVNKFDLFKATNIVAISTLTMARQLQFEIPSLDVILFTETHSLSEKDWTILRHVNSTVIAFSTLHPLLIKQKFLSNIGKQKPDFAYGISSIKLKDLADIKAGARYLASDMCDKGTWKFYRPRDINKNGTLEISNVFLTKEAAETKKNAILRSGDILLQNIFDFGKMAVVTEENLPGVASNNLFIIRSKIIPPHVLFEYLRSKAIADAFRKQLKDFSNGTVIRHLNLEVVGKIPVPLPFSKNQIEEFGNIKKIKDVEELIKVRDELLRLKRAYNEPSEDIT